ncbi:hypothetical protein F4679DRAFT_540134 [Xylaria curta]|nr:hypothetical protein F4679DRAFT_540134 [Xylaria curta]
MLPTATGSFAQPLERIPNDNIPKTKQSKTHYALYVLNGVNGSIWKYSCDRLEFRTTVPLENCYSSIYCCTPFSPPRHSSLLKP